MGIAQIAFDALTGNASQTEIEALAYAVLGVSSVCDDADQGFGPSMVPARQIRSIIERSPDTDPGILGINARMDAMQAAVLGALSQLSDKVDSMNTDLATLNATEDSTTSVLAQFIADSKTASSDIVTELKQIAAQSDGPDLSGVIGKAQAQHDAAVAADAALQPALQAATAATGGSSAGAGSGSASGGSSSAGGTDTSGTSGASSGVPDASGGGSGASGGASDASGAVAGASDASGGAAAAGTAGPSGAASSGADTSGAASGAAGTTDQSAGASAAASGPVPGST